MAYTTLPTSAAAAKQKFKTFLDKQDVTIVLILGDDQTAKTARTYAKELAGVADYDSVAFIETPNPNIIQSMLKDLPNPKVNLDDFTNYVALSISPASNVPTYLVSKAQFEHAKGYIKTAILRAMAG